MANALAQTIDGPLDEVNEAFHDRYDRARANRRLEAPVLVVLADELILFREGERRVLPITPRAFHLIKAAAHAPVAFFVALHEEEPQERLRALREHVAKSSASLDHEAELDDETRSAVGRVLATTLAFADRLDAGDRSGLDAFARESGPQLLELTQLATRLQLASLHAVVETLLTELDDDDRAGLHVVVTGNHQARARSLGMQYFRKRFDESDDEDRVAYAEGVEDADEALALVGTRRMDVEIATAFFGDAKRLQRDVLGDAVTEQLSKTTLEPIV